MTTTRPSPTPRAQRVEVSGELKDLMRRLKLGRLLDTLPERLALARTQHLPHHEFLEMLFADEVTRRTNKPPSSGPVPRTSIRAWSSRPGTIPPPSPSIEHYGPSCARYDSSPRRTTC
jgi:hypothetical protein